MRWAFPTAIDYYAPSATQSPLQPQVVQSYFRTDDCASRVHLTALYTDRRFLLYARKVQTQYPRVWPLAYTPIASAVQPHQ